MGLFNLGEFKLHSGEVSNFKIDCDALTDDDLYTVAYLISRELQPYNFVVGVPQGGLRLAEMFKEFETKEELPPSLLIVDDVLTTGASMNFEYQKHKDRFKMIQGAVIFDRRETYELYGNSVGWIRPLFRKR